jgi:uncharacterized membrane protein
VDSSKQNYDISFFRPTTEFARRNRNIVLYLVLIWAVAVFGFHILLRMLEKPTPEQTLIDFESVWPKIMSEEGNKEDFQIFSQTLLKTLGKTLKTDDRALLDHWLSWATTILLPEDQHVTLKEKLSDLKESTKILQESNSDDFAQRRKELTEKQKELSSFLAPYFDLEPYGLSAKSLPLELDMDYMNKPEPASQKVLEEKMKLYLTHNESFLTQARFLGFPFHYFYSAVFLLILFIFLCWLYCIRIGRINKAMGLED